MYLYRNTEFLQKMPRGHFILTEMPYLKERETLLLVLYGSVRFSTSSNGTKIEVRRMTAKTVGTFQGTNSLYFRLMFEFRRGFVTY